MAGHNPWPRWLALGSLALGSLALGCGDSAPSPRADEPLEVGIAPDLPPEAPPEPPGLFEAPGTSALRPAPRLGWPVQSVHITSSFGWRVDPVSGRGTRLHRGLDLRGAIGDLVLSIGEGRVAFVGHDPLLGTMVTIDHGEGLTSLYGHLSDVLVVTDAPVSRGAAIGLVGNTGRSAAPHLHLTVKLDGVAIDPLEVIGEPQIRPVALVNSAEAPVDDLATRPVDPAVADPTGPPPVDDPAQDVPPPDAPPHEPVAMPPSLRQLPHRSDDGGHG